MQKSLLDSEEAALKELEKQYRRALKEVSVKIRQFQTDIATLDEALSQAGLDDTMKTLLQSQKQSKIYQQQYQKALQQQIGSILDKMHSDNYTTVDKYLHDCYEQGYVGTMYSLAQQGMPIIAPIDQAAEVKAILSDSKVSGSLYEALGVDTVKLKKAISQEISRGIATGMGYSSIARNISLVSNAPLSRTKTIARTEGHRIQEASTFDAAMNAKQRGIDQVKQWDASLDGKTRDSHRRVDGEIKELDEKFSNGLMYPGDPNGGAAEVVNCRCTMLVRARAALDESELEELKRRAAYFGLDKTENFKEFEEKYLKAAKTVEKSGKSDIISTMKLANTKRRGALPPAMDETRYKKMVSNLQKQGVSVIEAKNDDLAYLKALGAEATVSGSETILHMGEIPSASAFFEEVIHLEQCRKYGELTSTDPYELYVREILANRKLLKNHKAYGFQKEDVEDIENNLARWEERFKDLTGVGFDESGIDRKI